MSWNTIYIVQYLGFYLALPAFLQFMKILYPDEMPAKLTAAAWATGAASSLTVLLTPPKVYTWLMPFYEAYAVALLLFVLGAVLIRAIARGREGAALFLPGTAALVLAVVNDSLVSNDILWGPTSAISACSSSFFSSAASCPCASPALLPPWKSSRRKCGTKTPSF
ncbi:MAG: 7TM diverse intracellular signaling domain-containing protein [Bacillota bacterium]